MFKRFIALGMALLITSSCASSSGRKSRRDPKVDKEKVYLSINGKGYNIITGAAPVYIRIILYINNPGEELYCPEVEWDWGDGSKSSNEGDCDPYNETTDRDNKQDIYSSTHLYRYGDTFHVRVKLLKNDKSVLQIEGSVFVQDAPMQQSDEE